jgi:hypothetical protein
MENEKQLTCEEVVDHIGGCALCRKVRKFLAEPTPTRWIPVSEELPEPGLEVLCFTTLRMYPICEWTGEKWEGDLRGWPDNPELVTHWKVLVSPDEEKTKPAPKRVRFIDTEMRYDRIRPYADGPHPFLPFVIDSDHPRFDRGTRFDYGFLKIALSEGYDVHIKAASDAESLEAVNAYITRNGDADWLNTYKRETTGREFPCPILCGTCPACIAAGNK